MGVDTVVLAAGASAPVPAAGAAERSPSSAWC